MPAARHTLLTWKGTLGPIGAPVEEWQISLKTGWGTEDPEGPTDPVAQANLLFDTLATSLMMVAAPHVVLRSCEFRAFGDDGKQLRSAAGAFIGTGTSTRAPGAGNGAATPILPPQCAVAISLVTERAGPSGKGRFWWPLGAATLGADLRLAAQTQETLRDYAVQFIDKVNAAHGQVGVYSTKGLPTAHVRSVKVGRAVDTQRRRRGDMVEAYLGGAVA